MRPPSARALAAVAGSAVTAMVFGALVAAGPPRGRAVLVQSEPEGASLHVDGEFKGLTPLSLDGLHPGPHALRLEKAGYQTFIGLLPADGSSDRRLSFELSPARHGALEIDSRPPGAELFLDGEFRGVTPLTLQEVTVGAHVLRIEKTNHVPWTGSVLVRQGERTAMTCELDDRVLEFLKRQAAENPEDVPRRVELAHYLIVVEEPEMAAEVYTEARALAQDRKTEKTDRDRLEKQIRKDMMWKGNVGQRFRAAMQPTSSSGALRKPQEAIEIAQKEEKEGRAAAGAALLDQALKHNPRDVKLLEERARLRIVAGDRVRVISGLAAAFRGSGGDLAVRMRLGEVCLANRGRFDAARRREMLTVCARQLAEARSAPDAERVDSGKLLTRLYLEAGLNGEAASALEDVLRHERKGAERSRTALKLGRLLSSMKRVADARRVLESVVRESPDPETREAARRELGELHGGRSR